MLQQKSVHHLRTVGCILHHLQPCCASCASTSCLRPHSAHIPHFEALGDHRIFLGRKLREAGIALIVMASNKARRIAKELADLHADTSSQIQADTVGEDVTKLRGSFGGPPGTPYEGGKYEINIDIPSEYPFRPPIMKFATKVWHPNVSSQTVSES